MELLIGDLLDNYLRSAWVFSVLHLLFLLYFLYRWRQNWREVGDLLQALNDNTKESDLLKYARDQISRYAGQGREPDLPRIERYITGRFDRGPDTIQPLINVFVIIGLMGTLFSLFTLGHQAGELREPKQILGRMGIAFSTSFFGVIWAMVCSVAFLTPLRRRTNDAIQEVGRRLTELSAEYEPKSAERAFEQLANTLRDSVTSFGLEVAKMSEREAAHRVATRAIITEFSSKTRLMLESLSEKVEAAQTRTEQTTATLKESVTTSLNSIKENFDEISKSWREELKQTVESSKTAAVNLSASSAQLAAATKEVAGSLTSVRDSLERTKDLGRISADVKRLSQDYLKQSGEQLDTFKKGLDIILVSARAVPDEWFTMLTLAGDELATEWKKITDGWQSHVTDTGNELTTRLTLINDNLAPVAKLLAPDGELTATLNDFRGSVAEVRELLAERAAFESQSPPAGAPEPAQPFPEHISENGVGQNAQASDVPNALGELVDKVEGIHTLLGDFVNRFNGHAEPNLPPAPTTQLPLQIALNGATTKQTAHTPLICEEPRLLEHAAPVESEQVETSSSAEPQPTQLAPVEQPPHDTHFGEEPPLEPPSEVECTEIMDEHGQHNVEVEVLAASPGEPNTTAATVEAEEAYRDGTDTEFMTHHDVEPDGKKIEVADPEGTQDEELISEATQGETESTKPKKEGGWRRFVQRRFFTRLLRERRDDGDN